MADLEYEYNQFVVIDCVNNAIIANAQSKEIQCAGNFLYSRRSRIGGKLCNAINNALLNGFIQLL